MPRTKGALVFGGFLLKRAPQGIAKCDQQDAALLSADKCFWEERLALAFQPAAGGLGICQLK